MEDQKKSFVFDSIHCIPVAKEDVQNSDKTSYYSLPVWGSIQGFKLMERFVSLLHNPLAREELRAVLFAGRGVFRNYKNVLKRYPEIELLWFSFKKKEMRSEIYRWYNDLRESWGLEKLGDVPEEIEDVLPAYFTFSTEKTKSACGKLEESISLIENELLERYQGETGKIVVNFWCNLRKLESSDSSIVILAHSISEDFAGALAVLPYPENSVQTALITSFFVLPEFRGLGIGKNLLDRCCDKLIDSGIRYVLLPNLAISDSFYPALKRSGFLQNSGNFIADLSSKSTNY
ncbi:MAG: hypothetical protein BKP49_03090 [Treponema sp. CETP13]|nr:MAG: hypothetical protein BKP49_03090 [Treponema sp. CETP13]